jgi:hypothetical protein
MTYRLYSVNDMLINAWLEGMWKEEVIVYKMQFQNLLGGSKQNHKNRKSEYPVSGPRFESWNSSIRSRNANQSVAMFGKQVLLQIVFHSNTFCVMFTRDKYIWSVVISDVAFFEIILWFYIWTTDRNKRSVVTLLIPPFKTIDVFFLFRY